MMNLKKKDLICKKRRTGSPKACPRFYRREESLVRRCCSQVQFRLYDLWFVLMVFVLMTLSSLLALKVEVCANKPDTRVIYTVIMCVNIEYQTILNNFPSYTIEFHNV